MNTTRFQYTLLLTFLINICLIQTAAATDDNITKQKNGTISNKTNVMTKNISNPVGSKQIVSKQAKAKSTIAIITEGEQTHNSHCYKCHTEQVYTRKNHFIKSIDALSKQVKYCGEGNQAHWFDKDTEAVVEFLNQKYYKF